MRAARAELQDSPFELPSVQKKKLSMSGAFLKFDDEDDVKNEKTKTSVLKKMMRYN